MVQRRLGGIIGKRNAHIGHMLKQTTSIHTYVAVIFTARPKIKFDCQHGLIRAFYYSMPLLLALRLVATNFVTHGT